MIGNNNRDSLRYYAVSLWTEQYSRVGSLSNVIIASTCLVSYTYIVVDLLHEESKDTTGYWLTRFELILQTVCSCITFVERMYYLVWAYTTWIKQWNCSSLEIIVIYE